MNKLYYGLTTILLIAAVYLMIIDNYLSSLAFFSLGVLYVIMGWQEKTNQPKIALFYFIIGLFIITVKKNSHRTNKNLQRNCHLDWKA